MMDDATETNYLTPALIDGEGDAPMHYLFEIPLITNQVVGKATVENRADSAWKVKAQHESAWLFRRQVDQEEKSLEKQARTGPKTISKRINLIQQYRNTDS